MSHTSEPTNRLEETLALCAAADPSDAAFAQSLLANAAPDVDGYAPAELAALAQLAFARVRRAKPKEAFVDVFDPARENETYRHADTVLIAVNDDQPFLFDSIMGEIGAQSARLIAAFHPVVELDRRKVSVIVVILEPLAGESRKRALKSGVDAVLAHARAAVRDWQAMRQRLSETVGWLKNAPPRIPFSEMSESIAFLEWLRSDHFTFLGCRDYAYVPADGGRLEPYDGGLGVLSGAAAAEAPLSDAACAFLTAPAPVIVAKSAEKSLVHRRVHLDTVGVKMFAEDGSLKGERRFVGLFAAGAYSLRPADIPLMRLKVQAVLTRAALPAEGHDAKALAHIIDTFPRDELFQADADELYETAMGILKLGERPLVRVFVRFDRFDRFVTAQVFLPRDRYNAEVRQKIHALLARSFAGHMAEALPTLNETALARIVFTVARAPGPRPVIDVAALEAEIRRTIRTWADGFAEALAVHGGVGGDIGGEAGSDLAAGFPPLYRDGFSAHEAVEDFVRLRTMSDRPGAPVEACVWRRADDGACTLRLKLYGLGQTLPLSQTLPVFENLGLKAISENAYPVVLRTATAAREAFVLDFQMETAAVTLSEVKRPIEEAFAAVLTGVAENDGFNRLVLSAGLTWRDVTILRAVAKYLRQTAIAFSQAYMELALNRNPAIARMLVDMFYARCGRQASAEAAAAQAGAIEAALADVPSIDDDRIIRRFRNAIGCILRSTFFQTDAAGQTKPYHAFKLDSRRLEGLPNPRPMVEVFVYSPEVEGIHLRFAKVARGGLRWSDRREDFRTEILGLVKAQQVKNTVIVPNGAKGGFYPKRLPAGGSREEIQQAGIAAYRIFVEALLDLTDNLASDGSVLPPPDVVRHDGDDPYLVVAADKGTASFSDIANAIALSRGFWLGDAFASGGSHGYDHKKMAITARGAWEAVKRHFRELGRDIQSEPFTCVGVGDMSGDVFGNGLLLSKCTRLVAAFDHRHIFVDPDPDPAGSWTERKRLFDLPRSSWADYDARRISNGGGVFARSAKTIALSGEMRSLFGLEGECVVPADLIKAILKAKVDLLFFGGIGTFVKASGQSHAEAGDRSNDAVRIDAAEIGAKVVGEGANLGLTQKGRIEAAFAGVRLNTDAIDNSAGVDTSDHEVNLKILIGARQRRGALSDEARDRLLAEMTDEVAAQVLQDNIDQTLALSVAQKRAAVDLDACGRYMRDLEARGVLDRAVECLPDDAELARRAHQKIGLTRPELSVLLAYAKLDLAAEIDAAALPDDPALAPLLAGYFPRQAAEAFAEELPRHRLKREIVTSRIVNRVVNLVGPLFVHRLIGVSGVSVERAVRATLIAEAAFGLDALKARIDALTTPAAAPGQIAMVEAIGTAMHRLSLWFAVNVPAAADFAHTVTMYREGVEALRGTFQSLVSPAEAADTEARIAAFAAGGAPPDLAEAVGVLPLMAAAPEIVLLARIRSLAIDLAAGAYFAAGRAAGIDRIRIAVQGFSGADHWEKVAVRRLADDLFARQRDLAAAALTDHSAGKGREGGEAAVVKWAASHAEAVSRVKAFLAGLEQSGPLSVAKLTLAVSQIGELA